MRVPSRTRAPVKLAGRIRAHVVPSRAACVVHGVPLCSYQVQPGTFTPEGGAPQGWQELNPQPAVLEAAALPLRHIPMQLKTARWGLPGERLLVERVVAPIQKPPGPPVSPAASAQTRACWHAFRLACTGWVTRDSR